MRKPRWPRINVESKAPALPIQIPHRRLPCVIRCRLCRFRVQHESALHLIRGDGLTSLWPLALLNGVHQSQKDLTFWSSKPSIN